MTIEQANAVNKVLRHMIGRRRVFFPIDDPEVVDAAALLADRAHKVLMAGLTGDAVRQALA